MRGSQTRGRAASVSHKYADKKGTLKVFPSRGQLDFSIEGLSELALLALKDRIKSGSDRALAVSADVGKLESVAALFAKISENFGRLDMLFINAGVSGTGNQRAVHDHHGDEDAVRSKRLSPHACALRPRTS